MTWGVLLLLLGKLARMDALVRKLKKKAGIILRPGTVLWSGYMYKCNSHQKWQRRQFQLAAEEEGRHSLYYSAKEDDKRAKGVIDLSKMYAYCAMHVRPKLVLLSEERVWRLQALSEEQLCELASVLDGCGLQRVHVLSAVRMAKLPCSATGRVLAVGDKWKRRHYVLLSSGDLLYFEDAELQEMAGHIRVQTATLVERIDEHIKDAPSPYLVRVICPSKVYVLALLVRAERRASAPTLEHGKAGQTSTGKAFRQLLDALVAVSGQGSEGDVERLVRELQSDWMNESMEGRKGMSGSSSRPESASDATGDVGFTRQRHYSAWSSEKRRSNPRRRKRREDRPGKGGDAAGTDDATVAEDAEGAAGTGTAEAEAKDGGEPPKEFEDWKEATADDGRKYYYHIMTRQVSWNAPWTKGRQMDVGDEAEVVHAAESEGEDTESGTEGGESDAELKRRQKQRIAELRERNERVQEERKDLDELRTDILERVDAWADGKTLFDMLATLHEVFPDKVAEGEHAADLSRVEELTFAKVRKLFLRAARKVHPDKLGPSATPVERLQAQHAFTLLTERLEDVRLVLEDVEGGQ